MFFKSIAKSAFKATKYVGLTAAGAAVAAVSGVFEPAELLRLVEEVLTLDPTATILVQLLTESLGGAAGPFLAVLVQQILKHRDKLKSPAA